MKAITRNILNIVLFTIVGLAAKAQNNNSTKNKVDTATKVPASKIDKTQAAADNYIHLAEATKSKFKALFPSKPGDTVYVVIAGINYTDPNLKLLKEKIDDVKNTKGLTSTYHNNNTVVKVVYKGGDASKLYDNLAAEAKELFAPEDIEGCRLVLSYKLAKEKEQ